MPSTTLPPRTEATLRAFWLLVASAVGAGAGGVVALVRRDKRLVPLALPVAAAVATPGLRRPELVTLPYKAWNRAGREAAVVASGWTARVAFVVVLATRRVGAAPDMPLEGRGSGWVRRRSQPAATYPHQDARESPDALLQPFARYRRAAGHEWAEALRPLIWLAGRFRSDVEHEMDGDPPSDVYTLY